jgi:hypothetical protein
MHGLLPWFLSSALVRPNPLLPVLYPRIRLSKAVSLLAVFFTGATLCAQTANRITQGADSTQVQVLPNHHPQWADRANSTGLMPSDAVLDHLTLVLARSPEQQKAFESFLAGQQNPASPDYHHWLTPAEVGERFGLSEDDIATVKGWLQSQGLHADWVSPSRLFIGFGGTAANLGRAFQTELHHYKVNGVERMSVSSDPMVPQALAPAIKAIRGLYSIEEQPLHRALPMRSDSPQMNTSNGMHFITPADFTTIYHVVGGETGQGQTIGILGRSRTNFADFSNFRLRTDSQSPDPVEIIPTAFGGVDPGPALTSPPSGTISFGDQSEATLDVTRAGSVAPGAKLMLVVATSASGGIGADAEYLVNTSPVPAQVMTISYGACESAAGPSAVDYWDSLFQQAAAEGISVFVSSGDSGASGCDASFATPPSSPAGNSPNYICSSSYATCVGGTEFNDASNPSLYWSTSNDTFLGSAISYIPEGGWNEPLDSSSTAQAAASGGGVSTVIATPSWQAGTGVPTARAGRYTPDVSFSSSCHDGYFACFAAGGGSCVTNSQGYYSFFGYCGTSAAAPSMAGVAALLDEKLGIAQGSLNPEIYQMAVTAPAAFHDVTIASSGVATCNVNTPSMCNNSIPGPNGLSGGQPGFAVTSGYDLVTGLGSLDVFNFFEDYGGVKTTPTMTITPQWTAITTAQTLTLGIQLTGVNPTPPSGTVTLTSGAYTSGPDTLSNGYGGFSIPAGALAVGGDTLNVTYTPDAASALYYNAASGSVPITVTAVGLITPTVWFQPDLTAITTAQNLTIEVSVSGGANNQAPTGTVRLTSGNYTSSPSVLNGDIARIQVPAQSLAVGTDALTVTYTPDSASASIYKAASSSNSIVVTAAPKVAPLVAVLPSSPSIDGTQSLFVTVHVSPAPAYDIAPGGTVTLSGGTYSSLATALVSAGAAFNLPAGSLPVGSDKLQAAYTPDAASSAFYDSTTGSVSITVTAPLIIPAVTVTPSSASITNADASTVTVAVSGGNGNPTPTGTVTLASVDYSSAAAVLAGGSATINLPAGALQIGTDTLTAAYNPDASSFSIYGSASGTGTVTVTIAPASDFKITAAAVSVTRGATTGNTSAITVTPAGGFTGSVVLTAAVTSSPAGAQYSPTLSFGSTSPVAIAGGNAGTATLTISTTAATQSALAYPARPGAPWLKAGGAALACLLLFGIPARRRTFRSLLGMLVLLFVLAGGMLACGGGGGGGGGGNTGIAGTTAGSYTVTVTGTAGNLTETATVNLIVQ